VFGSFEFIRISFCANHCSIELNNVKYIFIATVFYKKY
jgi:hypothetical protein